MTREDRCCEISRECRCNETRWKRNGEKGGGKEGSGGGGGKREENESTSGRRVRGEKEEVKRKVKGGGWRGGGGGMDRGNAGAGRGWCRGEEGRLDRLER